MNSALAHRTAKVTLLLKDEAGQPLQNTPVRAKLINHKFLFGMGAFDSLDAANPGSPAHAVGAQRTELLADVFNYGTLPFYWGGYEPTEGDVQFESRFNAAKLLRAKGVTPKGHPLCWHTVCADWLMQYDTETILRRQIDRIHRDVTAFKGVVDIWDVINEVVIMPVFDRYDNAVTRLCRKYGQVELVKTVFEAAKECSPDALLLINDFNLSEDYRLLIEKCLDAGVPIGAIGIQTHQHQGYRGKARLEEVLDRFSCFGLPLHFTENTLVSGRIMPPDIVDLNDYQVNDWPTTPEGEERQMREWTEMMNLLFSHPLVEAVTGWDLADGAWLNAPSGIIRKDNSVKPSYLALKELIHTTWSTDTTLTPNAAGLTELEGYRGTYTLTAGEKQAEIMLDGAEQGTVEVILK